MRVPDTVKDCVVFLGRLQAVGGQVHELELLGTGFIVAQPSEFGDSLSFLYLVTAKHVIDGLKDAHCGVRINRVDGSAEILYPGDKWWFHPSDPTVDVAAVPFGPPRDQFEFSAVPTESFATDENIKAATLGVGDEVFMTGLFAHKHGNRKNLPIVRMGNISALADEPIVTKLGDMQAHLIEARSLGGLSGSPAFVRQTISIGFADPKEFDEHELWRPMRPGDKPDKDFPIFVTGIGPFFLLGLMHGHWEISVAQKNEVLITEDHTGKVNMGIALVVPATKILEVINQPELSDMRKQVHEDTKRRMPTPSMDNLVAGKANATEQMTPKGATIPVPTKGQFMADLLKATQRKKPSE
jgi:hypothetical protein